MSNDEFDTWLSLVGRLLGLNDRQRKQISEELRDHLESRVADLLESGVDKKTAVMQAVEEFGDAAVLAKNLQSVSLANRKRWMMRFMTLATASLFLVALLTMAMWPENARFGSPSSSVAQQSGEDLFGSDGASSKSEAEAEKNLPSSRFLSNQRIREKLSQNMDFVYDAEPFGDVRAQWAKELQMNIVIDQNLDGVLDNNTEVSAVLAGIRISDGLRMILNAVDATYTIKNGVLLIISIDDENESDYLSQQMIDVREILQLIKESEADRIGKPILPEGGVAPGGGGGGVFAVSPQFGGGRVVVQDYPKTGKKSDTPKVYPVLTAEKLLVDTVTQIVHSDSWECTGGGNGMVTCIGGVLVLVQSEVVAEEVQDFMDDLVYQMKKHED